MVPAIHIQGQEDIASVVATIASTFLLAVDTIICAVKFQNQRLGWLAIRIKVHLLMVIQVGKPNGNDVNTLSKYSFPLMRKEFGVARIRQKRCSGWFVGTLFF